MTAAANHEPDAQRLLIVLETAAQFYADRLADSPVAKRWMTSRGWDSLTRPGPEATRWRPGYAPRAWTALTDHLRQLGHADTDLADSGLGLITRHGTTVDRFRNRLVLPLVDDRGVIGFVGRALPGSSDQAPKWLNPPRAVLYNKSSHLFGLIQNADRWAGGQQPVLVEGPGDAIAVSLAGRAAVALCGTALTDHHLSALDHAVDPDRGLVIAFDGDAPGRAALEHAWPQLAGRRGVTVVALPDGVDPGNYTSAEDESGLRALLCSSRPLAEALIDHRLERWSRVLDSVGGQVEAVRDLAVLIATDPSCAAQTITHLAQRVDWPIAAANEVLLEELGQTVMRPRSNAARLPAHPETIHRSALKRAAPHGRPAG